MVGDINVVGLVVLVMQGWFLWWFVGWTCHTKLGLHGGVVMGVVRWVDGRGGCGNVEIDTTVIWRSISTVYSLCFVVVC